jgi:hypothetical protein
MPKAAHYQATSLFMSPSSWSAGAPYARFLGPFSGRFLASASPVATSAARLGTRYHRLPPHRAASLLCAPRCARLCALAVARASLRGRPLRTPRVPRRVSSFHGITGAQQKDQAPARAAPPCMLECRAGPRAPLVRRRLQGHSVSPGGSPRRGGQPVGGLDEAGA